MVAQVIPIRKVGAAGVIADVDPYNLGLSDISRAVNVRYGSGKVSRGPVFRGLHELPFEPGYLCTIPPTSDFTEEVVATSADFGKVHRVTAHETIDMTPEGWTGEDSTDPITDAVLGGVSYLNRSTRVPIYRAPGDEKYSLVPGWDPNWHTRVIRSFKDYVIALNMVEGPDYFPTRIRWSDETGYGGPPPSWDAASTTTLAGFNDPNEMRHTLVDGLALGNAFFLYCTDEIWRMDFTPTKDVFVFRKVIADATIMNTNCVAAVGSLHFVFGRDDIYSHDGVTPESLAFDRVRDFIFNAIDRNLAHLCFVHHDPANNEVYFCYPSTDQLVGYQEPLTGCNRAAVLNYRQKTWAFYDLPNVTASTRGTVDTGQTWEDFGEQTWGELGGSWLSLGGDSAQHNLFVSRLDARQDLNANRFLGLDDLNGGRLTQKPVPECNKPAYIERVGMDMDELGLPLSAYKVIHEVRPQLFVQQGSQVDFSFGGGMLAGEDPTWTYNMRFDPRRQPKMNMRQGGRYLSWRLTVASMIDFWISGFDLAIDTSGDL